MHTPFNTSGSFSKWSKKRLTFQQVLQLIELICTKQEKRKVISPVTDIYLFE